MLTGCFRCTAIAESRYDDGLHVATFIEHLTDADVSETTFTLAKERVSFLVKPGKLVVGRDYLLTIEEAPVRNKPDDSRAEPNALRDQKQPEGASA
jgi:hypothetical protein